MNQEKQNSSETSNTQSTDSFDALLAEVQAEIRREKEQSRSFYERASHPKDFWEWLETRDLKLLALTAITAILAYLVWCNLVFPR